MENTARAMTIIHCIYAGILWLLGILTLLFNVWGLWAPWHLAGFGSIFCVPASMITALFSLFFSCASKNIKLVIINFISTAISVGFILLTVFVSSGWFW